MTTATDAFTAFEHDGWQGAADAYADAFGSLTTQCIEPLLDVLGTKAGTRLLDVACGPGYVAAAAAARGAVATGVDFSAAMVESAAASYPGIAFRQGSAEELPFPDASFDAVAISFGLFHFSHPDRALAEAHRVLKPSGRVAFTAWAPPESSAGFGIVLGAIARHGTMDVGLPAGPPFFAFSDAAACERVLAATGFADPSFVQVPQYWRLANPAALFEVFRNGTVRMGATLRAQAPAAMEPIRQDMDSAAARYAKPDGSIAVPMPATLAAATKRA